MSGGQNTRHLNLDGGLYHFSDGDVRNSHSSLARLHQMQLLIIQTARQSPSRAWLEYNLAFRKDAAAATGASDWSKMNLDLYNFHLRSPAPLANPQSHPLTAILGTMGSATGLCVNTATATSAVRVPAAWVVLFGGWVFVAFGWFSRRFCSSSGTEPGGGCPRSYGYLGGFSHGFGASSVALRSASSGVRSALVHLSIEDACIGTEISRGGVAVPFAFPPYPGLHIGRFGVVLRGGWPGRWRFILYLSSPGGRDVGGGVPGPTSRFGVSLLAL